MGIYYFNNFSQINTVITSMQGTNINTINGYQLAGDKVYASQTIDYPTTQTTSYYLAKDNDNYYVYQQVNGSWVKGTITEEQYTQSKSTGFDSDTRSLLFNGENYTKSGNTYNYTGEDVYFTQSGTTIKYDDITLTIENNLLTITFSIAQGTITGSYVFGNVNTTTVTLPSV